MTRKDKIITIVTQGALAVMALYSIVMTVVMVCREDGMESVYGDYYCTSVIQGEEVLPGTGDVLWIDGDSVDVEIDGTTYIFTR